jgi:hypothetical protein
MVNDVNREILRFVHHSGVWQSYQQNHLVANKDQGEGNDGFCLQNISLIPIEFLTCRKILRYETSGFTSHSKEGLLCIFITLKNPSTQLAFFLATV